METDKQKDCWIAGETETGQLTHRQKLTPAQGQPDRQKDCGTVRWTGKGTTQETPRLEGPLWGQQ